MQNTDSSLSSEDRLLWSLLLSRSLPNRASSVDRIALTDSEITILVEKADEDEFWMLIKTAPQYQSGNVNHAEEQRMRSTFDDRIEERLQWAYDEIQRHTSSLDAATYKAIKTNYPKSCLYLVRKIYDFNVFLNIGENYFDDFQYKWAHQSWNYKSSFFYSAERAQHFGVQKKCAPLYLDDLESAVKSNVVHVSMSVILFAVSIVHLCIANMSFLFLLATVGLALNACFISFKETPDLIAEYNKVKDTYHIDTESSEIFLPI